LQESDRLKGGLVVLFQLSPAATINYEIYVKVTQPSWKAGGSGWWSTSIGQCIMPQGNFT